MRWVRLVAIGTGIGLAVCWIGAGGLYLAADVDPVIPPTVMDDPDLPALDIGGVRLHTKILGPATAPVVVMLHGGPGFGMAALEPLAPLADRYRVVFYDQRGAGLSQRVAIDELSLDDYLTELHTLLGEVSPDAPVHLVGFSWGGTLAGIYLGRHPDRVRSAALVEPGFLSDEASRGFLAAMGFDEPAWSVRTRLGWAWLQSLHLDGPDPHAAQDFMALQYRRTPPADAPYWSYFCGRDPMTAYRPDTRFGAIAARAIDRTLVDGALDLDFGDLSGFSGPVLFLAGDCDALIGPDFQRAHHLSLFSGATLEVVAGAGHTLIGERPDDVVPRIRRFLDRTSRTLSGAGG